ncbi:tetratricopeptide repeat protein [Xanthomonadaceae bacterium JHOS43]|nr:tetratricopeptide repeat protein [Xanthomonadaceae bacterium JHOS43]
MKRGQIGAYALGTGGAGLLLAWVMLLLAIDFPAAAQDGVRTPPAATVDVDDPALASARRQISAGRFHDAIATLQTAVQQDDGTDVRRLARRLGTLGVALDQAGVADEAIEAHHRALELYESLDDPAGISAVTGNIGSSLSALGDRVGARHYLEEALALKQRHGIDRGVGAIHGNLAELAVGDGDLLAARESLERALETYARASDPNAESLAHANLGTVLAKLGQYTTAMEHVQAAETLARAHDYQIGLLAAQAAHAKLLMAQLRMDEAPASGREILMAQAEASLHQALAASQAQEDRSRSIRLLEALSELRQIQGRPEPALALLHQARALEEEQRRNADLARARVLSARYEHQRQQREIDRLRDQDAHNESRLARQQQSLWLMAALFVFALGSLLVLGWLNRQRRAATARLQQHNQELSAALELAHQERQRTETYALRHRRFLRLASEDLRNPLREMRTLAERALVEDHPDILRRSHAAIAQHATDLIWVAEQMLESADHDPDGTHALQGIESVDLAATLRVLVDEATPRALHRDQHLSLQCSLAHAPVKMERTRCQVALRELIDILLFLNPARTHFAFTLREEDGVARIGLDAGIARLPDWQDIALGQEHGDVTLRLALAWIHHAILDNKGHIVTERLPGNGRREIVIRFSLSVDQA